MAKNSKISPEIAAPPEQEDLLHQLETLKAQLAEKDDLIAERDAEIHSLEYTISTDLITFERQLAKDHETILRNYGEKVSKFPRHMKTVVRDHTGFNGQRLTKQIVDKSRWTDEQVRIYQKYEDALKELDDRRRTTMVAVTLIDDPDVADGQLNCGVNGQLLGLYYSNDYMVEGAKEGRRVQLIPYCNYDAIMKSYKVRFKPIVNSTGGEGHLPYKITPVVEASLATPEQIEEHNKKLRLGNRRRNMELSG
jgi:hypothetical protein